MYTYTFVDIGPEPKKNIINFGYWMSFKYERVLSHSFDRFYVVTKFILANMDDITFDMHYTYLDVKLYSRIHAVKHIPNMKNICTKIVPYVYYLKKNKLSIIIITWYIVF